ncbi:MAG TPA: Flp pilus assembly protein CpaB [Woeseiaceae bacterium]|nr:Flp pilus assembly protein CpaB [Woeseiaceae bacterium]
MNAKIVLALAVIAGLIAVFLVQRQIDNIRGETITVYKSAIDQKAGEVLGGQVEEVTIPAGLFPNLFEEAPTEDFLDLVQTTPLRTDVQAGDILLFRHFDSAVDKGVLGKIPPGMKAISIPVDEVSSVSFFIQPGDLVDVLATFIGSPNAAGPQSNAALNEMSTRPVVQAVSVLAVGENYSREERQRNEPYSSVTLLVSMEEAAKLVFAREFFGVEMTLVLRGEGDTAIDTSVPSIGVDTLNFNRIGNQQRQTDGQ